MLLRSCSLAARAHPQPKGIFPQVMCRGPGASSRGSLGDSRGAERSQTAPWGCAGGAEGCGGVVYGPRRQPQSARCGCDLAAPFLRLRLLPAAVPVPAVRAGSFRAAAPLGAQGTPAAPCPRCRRAPQLLLWGQEMCPGTRALQMPRAKPPHPSSASSPHGKAAPHIGVLLWGRLFVGAVSCPHLAMPTLCQGPRGRLCLHFCFRGSRQPRHTDPEEQDGGTQGTPR